MSLATIDIRSGIARMCAVSADGVLEASCDPIVHISAEGCKIGRHAMKKRALIDPSYEVMELDRTHLLISDHASVESKTRVQVHHIFALLLQQLQSDLASKAGIHVTQLVLPEPAGAGPAFRQQAARAAELSGLRIHAVVKESLAACHYIMQTRVQSGAAKRVMVLQFGADAVSASLLQQSANGWQLVSEGIDAASGDPIRQMLCRLVMAEACRRYGAELAQNHGKSDIIRIARRLKHELQECKANSVRVVDWIHENPIEINLQRDHLCGLLDPVIRSSLQVADVCLSRGQASWEQVDKIILLGELASWPNVVKAIGEHAGKLESSVLFRNTDQAVAAGAYLLGTAAKSSESKFAQFDFGIRVVDWNSDGKADDRYLIRAGEPLPTSRSLHLCTKRQSQGTILFQVICKKRDQETSILGELEFGPLPGTRRGYPVDVTVTVKPSHQVTVSIRDGVLGTSEEHHFDPLNLCHPVTADRQLLRHLRSVS